MGTEDEGKVSVCEQEGKGTIPQPGDIVRVRSRTFSCKRHLVEVKRTPYFRSLTYRQLLSNN
jgi:hypothetical protein